MYLAICTSSYVCPINAHFLYPFSQVPTFLWRSNEAWPCEVTDRQDAFHGCCMVRQDQLQAMRIHPHYASVHPLPSDLSE